jgi:hypothetical protein
MRRSSNPVAADLGGTLLKLVPLHDQPGLRTTACLSPVAAYALQSVDAARLPQSERSDGGLV